MQPLIDAITKWLKRTANHRDVTADTELIGLGILDSIEILNLVSFLEERFGVTLPIEEFVPENFATPRAIADLVVRLSPAASAA
ncbi:MAG TPA: acyl carrier protein [Acetobacteraceae bacterium]|jgi:acyl carrier protein|nr:acyl carrier protein [Acetobacteraceae bacterium]